MLLLFTITEMEFRNWEGLKTPRLIKFFEPICCGSYIYGNHFAWYWPYCFLISYHLLAQSLIHRVYNAWGTCKWITVESVIHFSHKHYLSQLIRNIRCFIYISWNIIKEFKSFFFFQIIQIRMLLYIPYRSILSVRWRGGGESGFYYSRLSTTHDHITDCKLDSMVYAGVRLYGTEIGCEI